MNVVLRAATADDESFLAELFRDVRAAEFSALGMPPEMLGPLLDMQRRAQTQGYRTQFPDAEDSIIEVDGERWGRLLVSRGDGEVHLVDIALLGRYRGRGVGGALVRSLCEECRGRGLPLTLSVREGNPAEGLYRRLGFVRTGGDGLNVRMAFETRGV